MEKRIRINRPKCYKVEDFVTLDGLMSYHAFMNLLYNRSLTPVIEGMNELLYISHIHKEPTNDENHQTI